MDNVTKVINHLLETQEDEDDQDILKDVLSDRPEPKPDPYATWFETYKPVQNNIIGPDEKAPFDGTMFETYGPELEHVRATHQRHVWTYLTGDGGEGIICAGYHFVNRMGYFITTLPWHNGDESFQVDPGDPEDAPGAAEHYVNHEMGPNWKEDWRAMPPQTRVNVVQEFAEMYGLERMTQEIITEIDKIVNGAQ